MDASGTVLPHSGSDVAVNRICISDQKAIVRECVGDKTFEFPANDFFQNNTVVLSPLIDYVRRCIFLEAGTRPTHLVDTYCGSGLFSISLASDFEHIAGIELSGPSIAYARHNATLNGPFNDCRFLEGKAEQIFAVVNGFPPERTVVIIDPPRKGCDEQFITQLLAFRPATLVYVSCNVHTQARDVGRILSLSKEDAKSEYMLDSLCGFDLFPQTSHVESVAILRLTRLKKAVLDESQNLS